MVNEPPCKGCMASVRLTASELERLIEEYGEQENEPLATTAEYFRRLTQCGQCSALVYETTCRHSGMLIQYAASFQNKGCPHPDGGKW
ncbi:hypothetical protein BC8716_10885 [Shouchella clausii]|nr:hypothetical protein BC8716_10885 [Shouchella clausii]PTL23790.1 hypothetical protein DA802_06275 [Shouchella clausii]QNM42779.1 hypothetical protein DUT88_07740 [Shouchella clausii]